MKYRDEAYEDTEKQFEDMRQMIIESYSLYQWPRNWLISRMEDWKYGGNSIHIKEYPDFFRDKAHLWWDENDRLAGFCVTEYGGNSIFIQTHPEYPDVEAMMLSWIVEIWAKDRPQVETFACTSDQPRNKLLSEFGFEDASEAGQTRKYDLRKQIDDISIAPGFRIERLSQNRNYDNLLDAINAAFDRPRKLTREWLESKLFSAPSMSEEWEFSAVTPDGIHASFCFAWIDRANKIAEIDPIGTRPEYQKKGLARAVIIECFKQLRNEAIRFAYIGSGPEPLPSNKLYDSLNPVGKWNEHKWVRRS